MKKFMAMLLITVLICVSTVTVFAARKLTDGEKNMLAEMQGKELLGRKISAVDIAALENFLMGTDRELTQSDIDAIIANIDEVIDIIITSGVTDIKNLPKDVIDKIMKLANSAASVAELSVSVSSVKSSTPSITITDKTGTPVVIVKEEIIKKTGSYFDTELLVTVLMTSLLGAAGVSIYNKRRTVVYGA